MKILDTVFEKMGTGMDHIGSVLDKFTTHDIMYKREEPTIDPRVSKILAATANNETGGVEGDPYSFAKPSGSSTMGRDMGKYQVTEGELKSWSKEFMGKIITPEQYMGDPKIQEDYNSKKVMALLAAGATPGEIFAMHRGGLTGYADPAIRKRKVGERQQYVDKALDYLKTLGDNQ